MQAHKVEVNIPDDHRLTVDLPEGFPAGPAEVIVLAVPPGGRRDVRLGGTLSTSRPHPKGDPIAEVLRELRDEREAAIEGLVGDFDRFDR